MTKEDELDELFMGVRQLKEKIVGFIEHNDTETRFDCERLADFLEDASRDLMDIASAMKNLEN